MSATELWPLIHEHREKVGAMLGTLTEEEWNTASLCGGWRVRDVAGHCVETHTITPGQFFGRFLSSGFRFDAFNQKGVDRHAGQSTAEVLRQYRDTMNRTTSPPGPKSTWLAEAVIHGEDMARPLGKHVETAPGTLLAVVDFARQTSPLLHGKQRSAGLKLHATDIDWSAGDGPEVSGSAASLILAITGRKAALGDLSGEGLETLRSRV
ncbi:MAG: maleylpyruvate isomerase family mycothiol-dependent enzyme [Candidatus Dormibacteraeota bacterium]|nr:maleylpyruvate isomerase family mycothiol-dependent enzyme [Candidatus Dormibacteraeota bacterium]